MGSSEALHPALRVALAWQPKASRASLQALLAFDAQLGRIVGQARESVLAQMRLAWWRERLVEAPAARPAGNPLLGAIEENLPKGEPELAALVDGWEELLGDAPLSRSAIAGLANSRADAFGIVARIAHVEGRAADSALQAARRWALADFAFRTGDDRERETALALADSLAPIGRLPHQVRGIAVLGALADRAISRREPLLSGRIAPIVALRVGMTGR